MKKILLTMAILLLISTGCGKHSEKVEHPLISDIQVETVNKKSVDNFYSTSATVKSKASSVVASMLMGKVISIAVQEGDFVKEGQLLLIIESNDLVQKATGAGAGVKVAQMAADSAAQNMKLADVTYQRYKNLYDEKVITKQEFDQYSTQKKVAAYEYQRALASVSQAKAGLEEVRVYQGYSRVAAPVSGVVIQKNIDVGSTAIQGQPLLTIETIGNAELIVNIDESYLDKVNEGQAVNVQVGDKTVKSKIIKVVSHVDPMTRTFKVKVDVNNLTGGQFAKIDIPVSKKSAIIIPKNSVVSKGELTGVYTVDFENIVSYRLVRTGKTYGENIEILSGLTEGDKIITTGLKNAIDGGKINEKQ